MRIRCYKYEKDHNFKPIIFEILKKYFEEVFIHMSMHFQLLLAVPSSLYICRTTSIKWPLEPLDNCGNDNYVERFLKRRPKVSMSG